jgi:LasA protease
MNVGKIRSWLVLLGLAALIVSGCQPQAAAAGALQDNGGSQEISAQAAASEADNTTDSSAEPQYTERPKYAPGELVDYVAQTGDTLPALAIHFNTSVEEILEANAFIPADATTLPPGMPMRIPIYYAPFWGSPVQIIPDSHFVNGPYQIDFDTQAFVDTHDGWFKGYQDYVGGEQRSGAGIVDYVATNFSVSPRVLLALLEYQTRALSQPVQPETLGDYPLGYQDNAHRGLYLQLVWAANLLNHGYYRWRTGHLTTIDLQDGTMERPDPWQNAASVAFQYYFSLNLSKPEYQHAVGSEGIAETYHNLFGDPWIDDQPHIPGSLQQPEMLLPFEGGKTWAYTGGPHTGWGTGEPFAALDFAPPSTISGCAPSAEWNTAVASGVVVRSEEGIVEIDLDGDGDPRTGWTVFHLHVATKDRVPLGAILQAGDPIGHPSCEGGRTTGTHIHIARKYNGEWIPAEGPVAFNLEGWVAHNGEEPYQGTLTRFSQTVVACECSNQTSQVTAAKR